MATVQYFLKIDGVEGESTDAAHRGEIEVQSFNWAEAQPGTPGAGGHGAGKVQPQDLQFLKTLDKASPRLFIACATGERFSHAILSARKAGGAQQDYLRITLEDVFVSSYQVGGSSQSGVPPDDEVGLRFARLEMSYKEQRADGSLGGEVRHKYDFAANRKL